MLDNIITSWFIDPGFDKARIKLSMLVDIRLMQISGESQITFQPDGAACSLHLFLEQHFLYWAPVQLFYPMCLQGMRLVGRKDHHLPLHQMILFP